MKTCGVELLALTAGIRQMEASGAPGISVGAYQAHHILADLVELARLRKGLEKLERVDAAAPLTGVAELVADPNGEAVLWSDIRKLLDEVAG